MTILFICLGNICRSPMAEFICKNIIIQKKLRNIHVISAGTSDEHKGEGMHYGTDKTLTHHNIEHKKFKSQCVNDKMVELADYIYVMDDHNLQDMLGLFPNCKNKIRKITDFSSNKEVTYVPDPWYNHKFELVYSILVDCINNMIDKKSESNCL